MGYGIGESRGSDKMAQIKSKTNARVNLLNQISGINFIYQKNNGTINFSTQSNGILTDIKTVKSDKIGDKKYLTILSSQNNVKNINKEKAFSFMITFRTENLEKSLLENYKKAIEKIINKKGNKTDKLEGTIYLTSIDVSDYNTKNDFKVEINILIITK